MLVAGCSNGKIPDPNDPPVGQTISGTVLLANVQDVMNNLDERTFRREITPVQRDEMLQRVVKQMLKDVDVPDVPEEEAWQFGDAYRIAGDWETAKVLYERAVKRAKSKDRIVNDKLRLARAQAHLGPVEKAIATARSTFDSGAKDKGPILMSVLYEIVPEGQGKGKDMALAKLLEDAIPQHKATIVDPRSEAGKAFLLARPLHVHKAWIKIAQLYQAAGREDLARKAILADEADRLDRADL
ncbi:MAG: hypothetical protein JST30_04595 [Armatimonadetes bacterium]|nr:hypothetical protein [Armatimonadota bacterium]